MSSALAAALSSQLAAAEARRHEDRAELAALSRRLVSLERSLNSTIQRVETLTQLGDFEEFAAAELDRLHSVPGVSEVEVNGACLDINTAPVHIEGHNLGRYRLSLDLEGDVTILSLDHLGPRPHWDHPHVQDGLPCLGNLREGILKLIAEYQLALATQVLLDFLHTYQPETAYTPLEGWA